MAGSVRHRGGDKWELRVSSGRDPATGKYRRVSKTITARGKRDAERQLAALVAATTARRPDSEITVDDLVAAWFVEMERTEARRPRTLAYDAERWRRMRPLIGPRRAADVTVEDIEAVYATLRSQGLSAGVVVSYSQILTGAWRLAVRRRWLTTNPCLHARRPRVRPKTRWVLDGAHRVPEVIDHVDQRHPWRGLFFRLVVITGARRSELLALPWADVDWQAGRITIARSLADFGGTVQVTPTKTNQIRRVAVDPATLGLLDAWAEASAALGRRTEGAAFVFPASECERGCCPERPHRVTQAWRRACKTVGLTGFTLHDLRHLNASVLIDAGFSSADIAPRLGHATPRVTEEVYSHLITPRDAEAAATIAAWLTGP